MQHPRKAALEVIKVLAAMSKSGDKKLKVVKLESFRKKLAKRHIGLNTTAGEPMNARQANTAVKACKRKCAIFCASHPWAGMPDLGRGMAPADKDDVALPIPLHPPEDLPTKPANEDPQEEKDGYDHLKEVHDAEKKEYKAAIDTLIIWMFEIKRILPLEDAESRTWNIVHEERTYCARIIGEDTGFENAAAAKSWFQQVSGSA
jgi:hypothetical protein